MQHLKRGGRGTWTDLALRFGYYDQAHLVREVRQLCGVPPTEARGMLIDLSAFSASLSAAFTGEVNSVQDGSAGTH
jgi:AraC-like DNA-binding protein